MSQTSILILDKKLKLRDWCVPTVSNWLYSLFKLNIVCIHRVFSFDPPTLYTLSYRPQAAGALFSSSRGP